MWTDDCFYVPKLLFHLVCGQGLNIITLSLRQGVKGFLGISVKPRSQRQKLLKIFTFGISYSFFFAWNFPNFRFFLGRSDTEDSSDADTSSSSDAETLLDASFSLPSAYESSLSSSLFLFRPVNLDSGDFTLPSNWLLSQVGTSQYDRSLLLTVPRGICGSRSNYTVGLIFDKFSILKYVTLFTCQQSASANVLPPELGSAFHTHIDAFYFFQSFGGKIRSWHIQLLQIW